MKLFPSFLLIGTAQVLWLRLSFVFIATAKWRGVQSQAQSD